jgi:1-aminocyclopropane-1-carboxylate deaminase/D-cysteine desulfhydrase-like pyridoxal-dependent ACC family enzyme
VPVSDDIAWHRKNIGDLCRRTIEAFGLKLDAAALAGLDYVDGYVGPGYAVPYPAVFDAMRRLARLEAIVLDPVYTGKAFCALLDGVRDGRFGRFGRQRPVVFLHTGGIFSNFAWPESFA